MINAIILAGGSGQRMGAAQNKVLMPVMGVPALVRSVKAFHGLVDGIVLVVRPEEQEAVAALMAQYHLPIAAYAHGGFDRQASVKNGLNALDKHCDRVLVHDGARALVTPDIISRVIASVNAHGSGVAAIPVTDTLKVADHTECIAQSLDRTMLRAMQTPQGFQTKLLIEAHAHADTIGLRGTDEAEIVTHMGHQVHLCIGSKENIKLTTPEDMIMANAILKARGEIGPMPMRVGQGYDVHQLVPGRRLILCGVDIPHKTGLLGHSDADVALHALMDALLGAAGLYDIGRHFSDKDAAYKDASSMALLEKVMSMLEKKGFAPTNCDITIVAQQPKLLPYIDKMRENVAGALRLDIEYINIKATTTEHMGFEGEEKGISAMAVCMLYQK